MHDADVELFLTHLAKDRSVAIATQKIALRFNMTSILRRCGMTPLLWINFGWVSRLRFVYAQTWILIICF
jgi:hypothetical protein